MRLLLVDDHESVRQGLRALFDSVPFVDVVGDAADGSAAIESVKTLDPDLVVLDLTMPRMSGLVAMRQIKEAAPRTSIVVLTRHNDAAYVSQLMAAGATGYVLKQSPFAELVHAIEAASRGERHLDGSLSAAAAPRAPMPTGSATPRLTHRETDVLKFTALGHSNKSIAAMLGIAVKTVEVHKTNAMRKLDIRDRIEIVRFARLQGWLDEP
jgi:DNA-binding NarL/FixJ family response regulator